MNESLTLINKYLDLVQTFSTDTAAYSALLHPAVEQTEFPNLLNKTIQRRSFSDILYNIRVGREVMTDPSFDVHHTHLAPDGSVLMEGKWQATTLNDVGALVRNQRVSGQFCLVFEFHEGKIYRMRRYACYDQV